VRIALAVVVASLAIAAPVRAQDDCAEGRVRTEGFCCWPGQTFSTDARRCEGAPHCPDGTVEHGEQCVLPLSATASPSTAGVPAPMPQSYDHVETTGDVPSAPPYAVFVEPASIETPPSSTRIDDWPVRHDGMTLSHVVRHSGEDWGLVTASLVVFDVGWALGILAAVLDEASHPCASFSGGGFGGFSRSVSCNSWPLALIPVGGGIASGMANWASPGSGGFSSRNNWLAGFALGIPSVILQGVGLISLAISLANEIHDLGFHPLALGDARIDFVPAAPASDLGLSIVVSM
jgi:hypothetical protein